MFTHLHFWNCTGLHRYGKWKWKSLSCVWLFVDSMDYTVHGILQARMLEWVSFPFSRGSSQPRNWTQGSRIAGGFCTSWATREAFKPSMKTCRFNLFFWSSFPYKGSRVHVKLILNEVTCFSPVHLVFVSLIYRAPGREPRRVNGKRFFFLLYRNISYT